MSDPSRHRPSISWGGICLDCADAEEMARFYREVFGWEITGRDSPDSRPVISLDLYERAVGVLPSRGVVRAAKVA